MLELVIPQRQRSLGGFDVGRLLPWSKRRMVGPFIFFDRMGPLELPAGSPESVDVLPHPHIGLSTITYLFAGEIMHRDSLASEQPIRPGEVNWMTAGRGITHSERFERARREGDHIDGIQAWVALPEEEEEREPSFSHHKSEDLPTFAEKGLRGRVIAGSYQGLRAAVPTHSPLFYLHLELEPGATATFPADYPERALYVAMGSLEVAGERHDARQMLVLTPGKELAIRAETAAVVMALGGEPLGPRFIEWNFVSSSRERIEQAKADWRAGRMKLPDFDNDSFIPLPPEPGAPANPMS